MMPTFAHQSNPTIDTRGGCHDLIGFLKVAIADSGVGPEGMPEEFQVRRK